MLLSTLQLHDEIETHSQHLAILTRDAAPDLVQAFGIGPDTAAEMLITFGDMRNESIQKPHLPRCAGSVRYPLLQAKLSAIASTEGATAKPMLPCFGW